MVKYEKQIAYLIVFFTAVVFVWIGYRFFGTGTWDTVNYTAFAKSIASKAIFFIYLFPFLYARIIIIKHIKRQGVFIVARTPAQNRPQKYHPR